MAVGWKFSRSSTDEGRSGGNPSEYAFDHDLKDFVRETLQNSNDAGQDIPETTKVTYSFRELTGDELETFLNAINWDADSDPARETLKGHIQRVADADQDTTVNHILKEIEEDDGRLLAVSVEDQNTHGLYGPEGGEGPFSALVLDELITEKEGSSGAGGSYGLGKAVLWSWSGLKTVFFNSVPRETGGEDPPRLIGRTQLPAHESDADEFRYEGRGLFGEVDAGSASTEISSADGSVIQKWGDGQGRPYSAWNGSASELADAMGITRPDDTIGTSVTVIGFCEPGGKSQPAPEELADEVAREVSKWFWPAILREDLKVTVETEEQEIDVEADTCDDVKPFIECVQNRNSTRDVLEQPGHVAVQNPTFEIENKETEDGEEVETKNGPISVYARLANPERSGDLANKVALIRGAGMVVKYYNRNRVVYGDREFHGVVLAGKARPWTDAEPTEADEHIDDYLQAAEPPRHDDWEYTKNLKSTYGTSSSSTIRDLQRDIVTEAIKDLVRQTREEGRLVAGRLADRLRLPEGRGNDDGPDDRTGGGSQVLRGTTEISFDGKDETWDFSGFAHVLEDDYEAWQATCTIQMLDEEGHVRGTIPIDHIECEDEDVYVDDSLDEPIIRGGPDHDSITFRGSSETNPFRGEARIRVVGEVFKGGLRS